MKKLGIFAPLFSLPNQYGIGDFSESTYTFIDFLAKINFSIWQILPLNPIDKYGSPYTSLSTFAIDEIYVSLVDLKKRGLINKIKPFTLGSKRVNYLEVRKYKQDYFSRAFKKYCSLQKNFDELKTFSKKYPRLHQYAIYKVLKQVNDSENWGKWKIKKIDEKNYQSKIYFEVFKQSILLDQWQAIHRYANKKKIYIMGDIPFYVGYDSADIFFNQKAFLLDKKYNPLLVAGVPPDYYNKNGQLWKNPIYDWNYLKSHKFNLVAERIIFSSKIYDMIRLDHFKGFESYYAIPFKEKTARNGKWLKSPGYDFFNYLFSLKPNLKLIAEDLGGMKKETYRLRDHFALSGMQVVQFTLIDEEINHHFSPYVHKRINSVIYLSTHDSDTVLGWINSLNKSLRDKVTNYLRKRYKSTDIVNNLFNYAVDQPSRIVILSISDILRLGKEGRINIPGFKYKTNWTFRFTNFKNLFSREKELKELVVRSKK